MKPLETHLDDRSVLGKVQRVLECFEAQTSTLQLNELMSRTGLAKGTVHRIANDLVTWGLLERVAGGYRLGLRLFELGQLVPRQRILRETALPFMEDLYTATREIVHLGIVDGVDVLYIEKLVGHRTAQSPSRMGGRMPLYCTAIGKALLAFSPPELFDRVVERGLVPRTPHTTAVTSLLRSQLEETQQRGFAQEREESAFGLGCVAAPVFGPGGHLVAGISVSVPTTRFETEPLALAVMSTAASLSRALGSPATRASRLDHAARAG
ncbi:IclR family transcriptional regulator [Egicoccus sp. AB-alg6-2]|uniref:IclR family transcriptional regulator n=1 Tax=Egicoccus sp. AB-alg6-2 TaxID=3242692 RepID=UPI00359DAE40